VTEPPRTPERQTYTRRSGVEEAPLQGEVMLFDSGAGKFFVLNRTMAYLWRHCDGTHTLEEIASGLLEAFDGAEHTGVRRDLDAALQELRALGLVLDSMA
jgi:PqqD family protein of HPr-rel-A system